MSHQVQFRSGWADGFHEVALVASTFGVCTFDVRNTARQKQGDMHHSVQGELD